MKLYEAKEIIRGAIQREIARAEGTKRWQEATWERRSAAEAAFKHGAEMLQEALKILEAVDGL